MNLRLPCLRRWGAWVLAVLVPALTQELRAQSTGLSREFYGNIPGNNITDLTSAPNYPANPTFRAVLTEFFETGPDEAENYGQRVRGYLSPPQSGNYIFWIASDDQSILYLSPDEDPAGKNVIANVNTATGFRSWFNEPNQQSIPIFLDAGRLYYIEALMKEGGGGDHLSVRWQTPQGQIEEPIAAANFFQFGTVLFPPEITRQPASLTVTEGESATFQVFARNSDTLTVQWQRNGVLIPGANRLILVVPSVSATDNGSRFRVTLANALGAVVSEEAVLTVRPDVTPPELLSAFNASLSSVVVRFSEPVATNTSLNPANYALNLGATVTSVASGPSSSEVVLTTSQLSPGGSYTLTVTAVTDRAATPNPVLPGTSIDFTVLELVPASIGNLPNPGVVQPMPGGLNITAGGRGIAGINDQAHFSYQPRSGNFDVQVRIESLDSGSLFSQAGLLVRQNLSTNSPFAGALATPSLAGSFFIWRDSTGAVAQTSGSFPVNYPQTWLRLKRTGTNFSGFASHDGVAWSPLGTAAIGMSNTVYLGISVSSRTTNSVALAAFRDFDDFTPGGTPAILPERVEPLGPSSRRTGLVISEIMYHSPDREDGARLEYIEIFNSESALADLSGFQLSGDVTHAFPAGTILPAGGFLVVAAEPDLAANSYGLAQVLGPWRGQLSHNLGSVILRNPAGAVLLDVTYSDEYPWPTAADGAGHSLVLARPSYGEGDVRAWQASDRRGGSPGRSEVLLGDPLRTVVINEILANTAEPVLDFIELYNRGTQPADLSGCVLTDDAWNPRFTIPSGTILQPGEAMAWNQEQLGFAFSSAGEAAFLINPDGSRVIDAIRFGPQLSNLSTGRSPNGADQWRILQAPSAGTSNRGIYQSPVVLNELMYNPPVGDRGEFIELYNRGTQPVNLRDWRIMDGVRFTFTNDFVLPAGGFAVVAVDRAYLLSAHPELDPGTVLGDYDGNLSNGGERIVLAQPELFVSINIEGRPETNLMFVAVSEVTYSDGGRWGRWADGDGSSLELIDPDADTTLSSNWADSDETAKSKWTHLEATGLIELGQGTAEELHVMLIGAGECLLDNVQVRDQGGASLVPNPGFEGGLSGWVAQGNHVATTTSTNGFSGRRAMHLRASAGGDNGANRVKAYLSNASLTENNYVTFQADVRWLKGHPDLLLRLKGNYFESVVHLPIPENLGTPGAPNSRRANNAGPAIYEVSHHPVVPAALEPVRVTARVRDPNGLSRLRLKYRYDPSVTVRELEMRDDGQEGDLLANDGLYSAVLPGQAAGVLVAFRVEAADTATPPAVATFPADPAAGECLVFFGDSTPMGSFGTYRLWMTQANIETWAARESMSNEALDGTIVYGNSRAIYNGGARYRGSSFIRPGYDGPTGSLCAYVWTLPDDELFLGADELNLDWLEQPSRDPTFQRERMSFWVGEQLGVPFSYQRYVQIHVNGFRRGEVYTDSQQPNGDYIESWFPENSEGEIFKIDDWFEFNDAVNHEFNVDARLERYVDALGQTHKTRYRWNWEKKSNRGLNDDYSHLIELVEALNQANEDLYTSEVQELIDLDGWLRPIVTRRVVSDWDGYGFSRGKNTFSYRPPEGGWRLLLWDLDFSLGGGSEGTSSPIYNANDPIMERMYRHPLFGRVYLQGFSDAVRGPLALGAADALIDANYAAFVGNGINAADPTPIKAWIAGRRSYLARLLSTNTAPWTITAGAEGITTDQSVVTLSGLAPIDVRSISVNGILYSPSWTTLTNWQLRIPVRGGTNVLVLAGVDRAGRPVPGASRAVTVNYTGVDERPEDFIRFTEIMYEPIDPDAEFIEIANLSTRTTFDLSGWRISGVDYDFPGGTSLAPGARVVVVRDRTHFEAAYGTGLPVLGLYPGRLDNAGETLRLLRPGSVTQSFVDVNEVTYASRLPWPHQAEGEGGSLQVLDPAQDNRRPANWASANVDGHGYSEWVFASVTDRAASSMMRISLASPGEVHVDDLSLVAGLVPRVGTELIRNGGFEEPLNAGWVPDPALSGSTVDNSVRRSGRSSLKLVVSPTGFTGGASLRQTLTVPTVPGEWYTVSFWYLPDRLGNDLTAGLEGGGPVATVDAAERAVAAATPGLPNSIQATLAPFPDIWINEVLPDNAGGTQPGWIEILNAGTTPVNLTGWSLSPDPDLAETWPFPNNTMLNPGAYLVVWASGSPGSTTPPGLHANFTLPRRNGSVILARARNGVPVAVDYLHYSNLAPGRTIGSFPDGAWRERLIFEIPTPGGPNDNSSLPVRLFINEWMSRNTRTITDPADGDYDDWFEIYNGGDEPVDLSGYSLTDDPQEPRKSVVPSGFILQPNSVMLVWADGEPQQNGPGRELHVDFALSFSGETLALYSPGGAILDLVEFGPQDRDVSDGLTPDGAAGSIIRQPTPSPRALNGGSGGREIRITAAQRLGSLFRLTWSAVPGSIYQLQVTDHLGTDWTNLGSPIVAEGDSATASDSTPVEASVRFYRVVRE